MIPGIVPVELLLARTDTDALLVTHLLDQATTAAWNAVNPVGPSEDEWRLVERAVGIDRGWNAAYQLVSTLDPPGQGRAPPNA
jgi:hypothetical protein